MSPARNTLNTVVIPNFAHRFKNGGKILFIGVDQKWDYKDLFQNCVYETMDIKPSRHPTILGDIQSCPQIVDNSYDGIIMTGVYEYLQKPQQAIDEIYRILKPGGRFLFCAPGPAYYGETKPFMTLDQIPGFLNQFIILMIMVDYYNNRKPYYIHTYADK